MKKILTRWLAAAALAALPAAALADSSLVSTTLLRFSQDARSGADTRTFAPLTEFLRIDAGKLGDGNLSAHLYGWGRLDLGKHQLSPGGTQEGGVAGSLSYGYLQYRFGAANAQARAGRFFLHEGIVNEQLDGVSARSDLPYGLSVSAFAGAPVHTTHIPGQNSDGKGDGSFGGRLGYRYGGLLELGLSGVYETQAPALGDPALAGRFGDHRLVGSDLWFSPLAQLQLMGHTSFNAATGGLAEASYRLQGKPLKGLLVTGEFNEYHDRDMAYSSALFATLLNGNNLNQDSRSFGASASYSVSDQLEASADYRHYVRNIGKADRTGAELRYTLPEAALRAGLGYHYLRASPQFSIVPTSSSTGLFHELRCYAMHDSKSYFASLDLIDYLFTKDVEGRGGAWEMSGSLGYHLSADLSLSGDLSYGSNPQYSDELKGLLRLSYTTKITGQGEAK